jgi:hypothetical protein
MTFDIGSAFSAGSDCCFVYDRSRGERHCFLSVFRQRVVAQLVSDAKLPHPTKFLLFSEVSDDVQPVVVARNVEHSQGVFKEHLAQQSVNPGGLRCQRTANSVRIRIRSRRMLKFGTVFAELVHEHPFSDP